MDSIDVSSEVKNAKVVIFSKTWCPYCTQVKAVFKKIGQPFEAVELDKAKNGNAIHAQVKAVVGKTSVPQVFVGGAHLGGCDDTQAAAKNGTLQKMLA